MMTIVTLPKRISDAAMNIEAIIGRLAAMDSVQLLAVIALAALALAAGAVFAVLRIARSALEGPRSR
jgi:hypothetical protein